MAPSAKELKAKEGDVLVQNLYGQYYSIASRELHEVTGFAQVDISEKKGFRRKKVTENVDAVLTRLLTSVGPAEKKEVTPVDWDVWDNVVRREDRTDLKR